MTALMVFPDRTRIACCATCQAWRLHSNQRDPYCPRLNVILGDPLTAFGCAAWTQDTRESYALELIKELKKAGAQ